MPKYTSKMKDRVFDTVDAIVRSPRVVRYCVGITLDPYSRSKQYRYWQVPYPHFAVLETNLSANNALMLEKELFYEIKNSRNNTLRRSKYVPDRIEGEYVNSLGGKASDNDSAYVFYVAWRSK